MGAASSPRLTFEEFERLPDEPGKLELLDGVLIRLPPAEIEHDEFSLEIYHLLREGLKSLHIRSVALDLGTVYHEVAYKLPGDLYLKPDVSVAFAAQARHKYLLDAPAIAIEIVSPGNSAPDMEKKAVRYFQHGALEVWQFYRDPLHVIQRFRDNTSRTLWAGPLTTPLLPGFELRLADLFANPEE